KVTLWDYCFEMPRKHLDADRTITDSVHVGRVSHALRVAGNNHFEIYQYPGEYARRFDGIGPDGDDRSADLPHIFDDGARTAAIRLQEEMAAGLVIRGESNCRQFVTGHRFALTRHFNGDGDYVLTSITHTARMPGAYIT